MRYYLESGRDACTIVTRARASYALAAAACLKEMSPNQQIEIIVSNRQDFLDLKPEGWKRKRKVIFPELLRMFVLGIQLNEPLSLCTAMTDAGHQVVLPDRVLRNAPTIGEFKNGLEQRSFRLTLRSSFDEFGGAAANLAFAADLAACGNMPCNESAASLCMRAVQDLGHLQLPRCGIEGHAFSSKVFELAEAAH